ncbi:MAG: response regulator transcription factor [Micropruina sp.]|uniref:response regulator n=1 Tax=Micropruina sp. TaxID=2737536 RepID=UPI0039E57B96
MTTPVRILVADDDAQVREAYRSFFAGRPEVQLVGEAHDGAEAIDAYRELNPDLVLMDLQMPGTSGIDAIRAITERWPSSRVVALTTFGTRDYVVAALRAGASGYLLKGTGGPALLAAIQGALAGEMPLSSAVRRELVASLVTADEPPRTAPADDLTPREVELVAWLAHGLTNRQIGRRMLLSEGSVKQYLTRIAGKLGVTSRIQVLVRAIHLGIVDPTTLPSMGNRPG